MTVLINFITIHKLMLNMKMESAKLEIKEKGILCLIIKTIGIMKKIAAKALIYAALQREITINQ